MCMVSVIYDYGRTVPQAQWTWPAFSEYQEIIRRLEALDKKLGEPDCHDPAKGDWMKAIEERLKKLEAK